MIAFFFFRLPRSSFCQRVFQRPLFFVRVVLSENPCSRRATFLQPPQGVHHTRSKPPRLFFRSVTLGNDPMFPFPHFMQSPPSRSPGDVVLRPDTARPFRLQFGKIQLMDPAPLFSVQNLNSGFFPKPRVGRPSRAHRGSSDAPFFDSHFMNVGEESPFVLKLTSVVCWPKSLGSEPALSGSRCVDRVFPSFFLVQLPVLDVIFSAPALTGIR